MKFFFFTLLTISYLSGFGQGIQNVVLLDNWKNDSIPNIDNGIRYNECWGFVHDGEEYGVMGSTQGTHIFRLTDDDQLEEVAFVPGAFQGYVVHRDYHDYNGYLYAVCDQGQSTLQIIDLSGLPESVEVVYDSNEFISTAHNVFVDTATAKLYAAGPAGYSLAVLSVENPEEPEFLYPFLQVNYVHDIFVRSDSAYLNCANQGLVVVDFSGDMPVSLGSLETYPDQGYNHSGWLSEDGNKYILADENAGLRMKVLDVSDLGDIQVSSLFGSEETETSVPHNMQLIDDTVYVAHYNDGLQIYDVTNPEEPVRIAYYDTFTGDDSYEFNGAWGTYAYLPSGRILMSDRVSGMYLFRLDFTTTSLVEESTETTMQLAPNPTTGQFQITCEMANPQQVVIYNLSGQQVREIPVNSASADGFSIDGSDLPKGMYVVELRGPENVLRSNLIKF